MFMLTIIALMLGALAMYAFVKWFNNYTLLKANHQFFNEEYSAAIVIGYSAIFWGNKWFMSDWGHNGGDWLNGAIVIGIGVLLILGVIIVNFKNAPFKYALMGTVAQAVIYIPVTIVVFFIVVAVFLYAAQTRPVYNINSSH